MELSSVAKGFEAADAMLKASDVTLLLSRSVCPGKYIVLVSGEVGAVNAAIQAGAGKASHALIDNFVIPNIHPEVFPAIEGTAVVEENGEVHFFDDIYGRDAAEGEAFERKAWVVK